MFRHARVLPQQPRRCNARQFLPMPSIGPAWNFPAHLFFRDLAATQEMFQGA
eukprot:NODE_28732_length_468_cov_1.243402.p5 GENE.NODE_28732_length_468_cov_1.243402~~NODE_28732_length_468_cov_1.243402.p5  ORF type:complete len:52 (-),score=1.62 NODE_28732_length_468_cov_1.243402:212-367(-)